MGDNDDQKSEALLAPFPIASTEPQNVFSPKFSEINYNVRLCLLYTLVSSLGEGIWSVSTLSAFVYRLSNDSNVMVGNLEAAQGAAQLVAAPLCGLVADRVPRHTMLKGAAVWGMLCVGGAIFVVLGEHRDVYMFPPLCCWGVYSSLQGAAFEAIFADSMTNEARSFFYSRRQVLRNLGMMLGPIMNVILYARLGNEWTLEVLRIVMTCGLALSGVATFILMLFSDKKTLRHESESSLVTGKSPNHTTEQALRLAKYGWIIPWVMFSASLVFMIGAGMTVKFFPIFFLDVYGVSPIVLNVVYVFVPAATALFNVSFQRLSLRGGRLQLTILSYWLSIGCLVALAVVRQVHAILIIFVFRGAFANCTYPLQRSVVMQYVPKRKRGRWSALESLLGTFWTGSASMGGYLIDQHGFRFCYYITACVYAFASLILVPLLTLVPK